MSGRRLDAQDRKTRRDRRRKFTRGLRSFVKHPTREKISDMQSLVYGYPSVIRALPCHPQLRHLCVGCPFLLNPAPYRADCLWNTGPVVPVDVAQYHVLAIEWLASFSTRKGVRIAKNS